MCKFLINGRTKQVYELTNEELISLVNEENLSNEDREVIKNKIIERFKYACCKRSGETNDNVFARQFSNFVNGRMCSQQETAQVMANDHRYLQQEMFKVFLAYAQILSHNYNNGFYDGRNEYACKCANEIISALEEKKLI